MRLKVNKEKSKVDQPKHRKFLGFSFYNKKGGVGIRIAPSSIEKFHKGIKALCRQGRGWNLKRFIKELLNPYLRGWVNYYLQIRVAPDTLAARLMIPLTGPIVDFTPPSKSALPGAPQKKAPKKRGLFIIQLNYLIIMA
jgi:predicted DNA binding CopG/RHH family protein